MSILAELFENGSLLEVMMDFGEEVVSKARSNVRISQTKFGRKRKASTTGALQASLKFDLDVNTGAITFGSDLIYARTIEFGAHGRESTPRGESQWMTPARMPPSDAILKWMDMKKIRLREKTATGSKFAKETESKRKSVAYAIAKGIEKKVFVEETLSFLQSNEIDYTEFFRGLTHNREFQFKPNIAAKFEPWKMAWNALRLDNQWTHVQSEKIMLATNPNAIPRNAWVEEMIHVSRWMTWLPISLKNAAKCDKWYLS